MRIATFSLVARDPDTGDLGVAVASKFLAVGAVVPFAEAGVGAIATQSYANPRYGPQGLALLRQGASPKGVLEAFRRTDPDLEKRQFGLVAATGESLTFTGAECHPWAGGLSGEGFAAQGNLLSGPEVVGGHGGGLPFRPGSLPREAPPGPEGGGGGRRGPKGQAVGGPFGGGGRRRGTGGFGTAT
jgi:hypothetical protein